MSDDPRPFVGVTIETHVVGRILENRRRFLGRESHSCPITARRKVLDGAIRDVAGIGADIPAAVIAEGLARRSCRASQRRGSYAGCDLCLAATRDPIYRPYRRCTALRAADDVVLANAVE